MKPERRWAVFASGISINNYNRNENEDQYEMGKKSVEAINQVMPDERLRQHGSRHRRWRRRRDAGKDEEDGRQRRH